jgi:DNA-damage-inducible protein D
MDTKLVILSDKEIRRTLYNNEWWFSVVDLCRVLTDSLDAEAYWRGLKMRLLREGCEVVTMCHSLELSDPDGKKGELDCVNTEGLFRIIQSIPSSEAEAFKRWLAEVGCQRIRESEDPELAADRTRELYRAKGYSEAWIEKRMLGIAVRDSLTGEWKNRGVTEGQEQALLSDEISKAAFGLTPAEHKEFKGLERENLRDHMTDLELIFSMLGEAATAEIAGRQDAQGLGENMVAARKGGRIARGAREKLEIETGGRVVTPENFLTEPESRKRLKGRQ